MQAFSSLRFSKGRKTLNVLNKLCYILASSECLLASLYYIKPAFKKNKFKLPGI